MDAERAVVSKISRTGRGLEVLEAVTRDDLSLDVFEVLEFVRKHTERYGKQPGIPLIVEGCPDFNFEDSDEPINVLYDRFVQTVERRLASETARELARVTNEPNVDLEAWQDERRTRDSETIIRLRGKSSRGGRGSKGTWSNEYEPEVPEYIDGGGRFPKANVTLIVGEPGQGKGLLGCQLASCISRAAEGFEQGVVAFIGHEDGRSIVSGRLAAARSEPVLFLEAKGQDNFLTFPRDVDVLRQAILEHDLTAVVVDPFENHLDDDINPNANRQLRRALTPLVGLAQETGCAIIIVHHTNKGAGLTAASRILGSDAGYRGGVRSVLLFGSHKEADPPEPDVRYLLHVKANYGRKAMPLKFSIQVRAVKTKTGFSDLPHLHLVGEADDVTEADLFAQPRSPGRPVDEELRQDVDALIAGLEYVAIQELIEWLEKRGTPEKMRTVKDYIKKDYGWESVRVKGQGLNVNYLRRPGAQAPGESAETSGET